MPSDPELFKQAQPLVAAGVATAATEAAVRYLRQYGYLDRARLVSEAVRAFRYSFNLPIGGGIDAQLLHAMTWPRCGVTDAQALQIAEAVKKWGRKDLTYFIAQYVGGLSASEQVDLIRLAWNDWEKVCGITLRRTDSLNSANILIGAGRGRDHNFDGPGDTLAWAYLPDGLDGQLVMRFDLDETWVKTPSERGILFRNVACHEFGHLLGLEHSRVSAALMAPYYNPAVESPQENDDIPRARALYGLPAAPPVPPPQPPLPPPPVPPVPVPPPTPPGGDDWMDKIKPAFRALWPFVKDTIKAQVAKSALGKLLWGILESAIERWLASPLISGGEAHAAPESLTIGDVLTTIRDALPELAKLLDLLIQWLGRGRLSERLLASA